MPVPGSDIEEGPEAETNNGQLEKMRDTISKITGTRLIEDTAFVLGTVIYIINCTIISIK